MPRKIYVASSWRNPKQPEVVMVLRSHGHEVYDFRAPDYPRGTPGGFSWAEIDPGWKQWGPMDYLRGLADERAQKGLNRDRDAILACDSLVMVQPCGVSSALELGMAIGLGKRTAVLLAAGQRFEPELMLGCANELFTTLDQVVRWMEQQ